MTASERDERQGKKEGKEEGRKARAGQTDAEGRDDATGTADLTLTEASEGGKATRCKADGQTETTEEKRVETRERERGRKDSTAFALDVPRA